MRATATAGQALPFADFIAEAERCPSCAGRLGVQKSTTRTVVTLAQGHFTAREVSKRCDAGHSPPCPEVRSEVLLRLVRPRQRFGYDLVVYVGIARYLQRKQRDEIREDLAQHYHINLSAGSVSHLCDRFLQYLEALHLKRAPQLREVMRGGYPLHIDATSEQGRGGLFICMDGWRNWVLTAARIGSESGDQLRPLVEKTTALFGLPVATVRDMGEGMAGAVEPLRNLGIPDLICHYHFLAAVGAALLERPYQVLRNLLHRSKVRPDMRALLRELRHYQAADRHTERFGPGKVRDDLLALVLWLLQGSGCKDAPFPFSVPHVDFVLRCLQVHSLIAHWVPRPWTQPEKRAIEHLQRLVGRLQRDHRVATVLDDLQDGQDAFAELRGVLRLGNDELPRGDTRGRQPLLPALELVRLEAIKQAVDEYQAKLEQQVAEQEPLKTESTYPATIILKYFARYGARLFGHPARRDEEGTITAVTARTNNVAEHFFGNSKQQLRRRLGRARLARDLEQQPAQAALTANLRDPVYVRILCGSLENLPTAFAALNTQGLNKTTPIVRDHRDKVLQGRIKALFESSTVEPEETCTAKIQPKPIDISRRLAELDGSTESEIKQRTAQLFSNGEIKKPKQRDPRLPCSGTVLTRLHQGIEHQVTVLADQFTYCEQRFTSLSTIAKVITGTTWNGFAFFGLGRPRCENVIERAEL